MPDPTLFVDQCIAYRIDPGRSAQAVAGPLSPVPGQTTMSTVRVGNDPRNLVGGTPWRFTFLKYWAGEVTTSALAGGVLTGPMSGCYLFRYTHAGRPSVAHVGTDTTPDSAGTVRAKAVWRAMMARPGCVANGEAPTKIVSTADQLRIAQQNLNQLPQLCGYFEGGNAWAILFVPAVAGVTLIPGVLRIAAVRRMPLLDWSAVAAMREWR